MLNSIFDLVLVISMPENEFRRRYVSDLMSQEGIDFQFIDAVRPRLEDISYCEIREMDFYGERWDYFRDENYIVGVIGCKRSHVIALKRAKELRARSVAVFEDDVVFAPNWREVLMAAFSELPDGWLQLYLGGQCFGRSLRIASHLSKVDKVWASHATVYRAEVYDSAIAALENIPAEADVALWKGVQTLGRTYLVTPTIAVQQSFQSQITAA